MESFDQLFSPLVVLSMLPWMFLFAWIARRLLGATNLSLTATLISGGVGYIAGLALAYAIFGLPQEPGASDFTLTATILAIGFMMMMIVGLELLGQRGIKNRIPTLPTRPHPFRELRLHFRVGQRFTQVIRIIMKYRLGGLVGSNKSKEEEKMVTSGKAYLIRKMLEESGGIFVKLGQLLSTRVDLIPPSAVKEFTRLQEHAVPADSRKIYALVEEELGCPVEEIFASFELEPLASASLGQVHAARLKTGEPVAVKVQRPGIEEIVERDLAIIRRLATLVESRTDWGKTYGVVGVAEEFAARLKEELNYRNEAANALEMTESLNGLPEVHVHKVWENLSTSRLLVMEYLQGTSVGKLGNASGEDKIDKMKLADALLRSELESMLSGKLFHADPHPGNVFLLKDGRLGLLDFGAADRLDAFERASITAMLGAIREGDPLLLREAVFEVVEVPSEVNIYSLDRALAQFMVHNLGAGSTPNAAALNELLRVFGSHGIAMPSTTATMFRALVTLEGTLNLLVPGYRLIEKAKRLGYELTSSSMMSESQVESINEELVKLLPLMKRVPRHLDHIASLIERGKLQVQVSLFSNQKDVTVITELVNRSVLALAGSTVGIISAILLSIDAGPAITSALTLLELLGYIGLSAGATLILRVVLAALRTSKH